VRKPFCEASGFGVLQHRQRPGSPGCQERKSAKLQPAIGRSMLRSNPAVTVQVTVQAVAARFANWTVFPVDATELNTQPSLISPPRKWTSAHCVNFMCPGTHHSMSPLATTAIMRRTPGARVQESRPSGGVSRVGFELFSLGVQLPGQFRRRADERGRPRATRISPLPSGFHRWRRPSRPSLTRCASLGKQYPGEFVKALTGRHFQDARPVFDP
jgi:hypothetical protein